MRLALAAVVLAALGGAATAQVVREAGEPGYSVRFQSCIAAPPARTELGRLECARDELVIQTSRLDDAEAAELARAAPSERAAMAGELDSDSERALEHYLRHGTLATRITGSLPEEPARADLERVWRTLADCLAAGEPFSPKKAATPSRAARRG